MQCKKGDNDPLISLRARKARLCGDWVVKKGTYRTESGKHEQLYYITTTSFTEADYERHTDVLYQGINQPANNSITGTSVYKMTFKKDGNFESTHIVDGSAKIIKGQWSFTGAVGKAKNKEQIVISPESIQIDNASVPVTQYSGTQTLYTYSIKELRNKKMVIYSDYSIIYDIGYSETSYEEYTLEQ